MESVVRHARPAAGFTVRSSHRRSLAHQQLCGSRPLRRQSFCGAAAAPGARGDLAVLVYRPGHDEARREVVAPRFPRAFWTHADAVARRPGQIAGTARPSAPSAVVLLRYTARNIHAL